MTDDEKKTLESIKSDLYNVVNEIVAQVPQPTRAILVSGIFIARQKVRSLLGEEDDA